MAKRPVRILHRAGVLLVAAAAWFYLVGPTALGGPMSYGRVNGSSMEPTLRHGEIVLARRASGYRASDIVVFRVPDGDPRAGRIVIHRIVDGSASAGFVTRGDRYDVTDGWRLAPDDIAGKLLVHFEPPVPLDVSGGPVGALVVLTVVAALLLAVARARRDGAP